MTGPTDIERRQFGALADDVAFLRRGCGLLVAPYRGGWRINDEVTDDEGLGARARLERKARKAPQVERNAREPAAPGGSSGHTVGPTVALDAPIVVLERRRLGDEAYRRRALVECGQAALALIDSFPEAEREALVATLGERFAQAALQQREGR
jgi:hypothetical protein